MGSEPVVQRGESLIKCHWNIALQHDDLSQEEAEPGQYGCERRRVPNDLGMSLSDGDSEVFSTADDHQLALKRLLLTFQQPLAFTRVPDGDSHRHKKLGLVRVYVTVKREEQRWEQSH